MKRTPERRFRGLKRYGLAVGVILLALGALWLVRWKKDLPGKPGVTSRTQPTSGEGQPTDILPSERPEKVKPTGEAQSSSDFSDFADAEIKKLTEPPALSTMMKLWIGGEKKRVGQIEKETFETTLEMMVDWDTNYYKLVVDHGESTPATPKSLNLIIYSRRFAKLLEETQGKISRQRIASITNHLRSDLAHWRELTAAGQSLVAPSILVKAADRDSSDLIFPLTLRINATILLIGERSLEEGLPPVLEAVHTIGADTNWALVGYTCDKIMSVMDREKLNAEEKQILSEYDRWKAGLENKSFSQYEVVELPSFRSTRRPFERATSLGAKVSFEGGKVSVEMPPLYTVILVSLSAEDQDRYYDPSGNNAVAKEIVEYARRLHSAKQ